MPITFQTGQPRGHLGERVMGGRGEEEDEVVGVERVGVIEKDAKREGRGGAADAPVSPDSIPGSRGFSSDLSGFCW